jgi:toxin ParE1/3/4
MRVVWTEEAVRRLAEIEDYVAWDNQSAAAALIDKLINRAVDLERFPKMGRKVPEIDADHIRELIEGNYRIVYRLKKQTVEILTVIEGHKLLRAEELGEI